jgi:putative radical SAM enzyme (TIGR03279 family)
MHATINHVTEGSIAHDIGLHKGDLLTEINGKPIRDVIDYMYYSKDDTLDLKIQRGNRIHRFKIKKKERADIGFEIKPFRIRTCKNKCIFCFVHQLPKGMRKSLYLKDDDYRMSFLYGNYITLTNLSKADKQRIISQRLHPLYVSVHSTNSDLRRKILGNSRAPEILKELRELTSHKLKIHAQIVVCPGLNDGDELINTIKDLQKFYPYVASIAVVPVGLTKYKKAHVKAIEKPDAIKAIDTVNRLRKRFKKRHGDPLVYLADEFYIKAEAPFPAIKEYGDLPQLENGVGMIPVFMNTVKKIKIPKKVHPKKIALFTGTAFMPYLEDFTKKLETVEGLSIDLFKVENRLFGSTVTVTGLLSGKDVLKTLVGKTKADYLLVPNVVLKNGEDVFLDNVTLKDMEESLGIQTIPIEPSPAGLMKGVKDGPQRED